MVPAPAPDLTTLLQGPRTFLVNAVAHLADAVLGAILIPFGPGMPLQSPMVWTILAFVRDEFDRILMPNTAPAHVPSSLVQSPNLLVNGGAEAGDPSLSGYAAVTVPGWDVTGTPTVIGYGTERRFPFPTASPGPVLPSFLAFPRSDGTIPTPAEGRQFFGGGPVADSALTQAVDLSAAQSLIDAGNGTFTLGGDLGGFFIDPSKTTVSVDFLDTNGVTLGTGALASVTALDRLFTTGFIHRQTTGAIPVGTRSAQVAVVFDDRNPLLGNYDNAYADDLSFTVNDPALAPAPLAPPTSTVGALDHVFMVYLENKGVGQIIGSPNAPYLNLLIDNYGYASNYYALTHPSDPNYYPIIGGSDFGLNYNCPSNCFAAGTPNLADSIDAAGKTWAGYAEGGGGYSAPTDRLPFLAFSDIYNDPQRVATHLFDISSLQQGLTDPATAPNFVWFAADDATNMEGPTSLPFGIINWALGFLNPSHQYNVKAGDDWLQEQLTTIFNSPTWQDTSSKSAIFVTFDEDYNNISTGVGNEGNHIAMIVIPSRGAVDAGMLDGGFVADDHYDHYSLQRTIELSLGLAPLTNNDRYAQPMNEFWV
ncbi:MAG: phosphoesterase [Mycolicibacterium sp.]|nr:phosphoesterase [Mycolicibacterium sp.]